MCGIVGVILNHSPTKEDHFRIKKMADAINHRGPNGFGLIESCNTLLAVQRLSIIELQSNHQPVSNADESIFTVFNGEIFNFIELKKQLIQKGHVFRSNGDSEVIVHLYEEYGYDFINKLDGQFVIALWDKNKKILLLIRDHMGICPLYYVNTEQGLYFCSEIKGLIAGNIINTEVNHNAFAQISYFGTVCAPTTPFKNIHALPHSHCMTISSDRNIKTWKYWDLSFPLKGEHSQIKTSVAIENLQHQIENAVSSRMLADVPIGSFFSGGIDSALITAIMKQTNNAINQRTETYTVGSSNHLFDESSNAIKHSNLLNLSLETLVVTDEDLSQKLPQFIWHSEYPVVSTEAIALMLLAKKAQKKATVILTGEGADEAFGGYLAFRQFNLLGSLTRSGLTGLRSLIRPLLKMIYGSDCLLPDENNINETYNHFGCFPAQAYEFEFYRSTLRQVFSDEYLFFINQENCCQNLTINHNQIENRHWLDQSLYVSYQIMLPNYLLGPHGDRVFAANSMEGRYPFLAKNLVEYASGLHPNFKIKNFREKHILREASRKWLPDEIVNKKKKRFTMPMISPFIKKGVVTPLIADLLSDSMLKKYGYFEPRRVNNVINSLRKLSFLQPKAKNYLLNLGLGLTLSFVVSTQLWHYQFIEKGSL